MPLPQHIRWPLRGSSLQHCLRRSPTPRSVPNQRRLPDHRQALARPPRGGPADNLFRLRHLPLQRGLPGPRSQSATQGCASAFLPLRYRIDCINSGDAVATINVRLLDDDVVRELKRRAAENNRSLDGGGAPHPQGGGQGRLLREARRLSHSRRCPAPRDRLARTDTVRGPDPSRPRTPPLSRP